MGTPQYAVATLQILAQRTDVVAVYSRADARSKRGNELFPSPVKVAAEKLGISVFTPSTLKDDGIVSQILAFAPDLIVVAAYGMILPRRILDIPRLGCVNLHASLLPTWRGAAPVQRAILAGDEETGVSLMRMEEGLDTGDYAMKESTEIGHKSTAQLTRELGEIAADLMDEVLDLFQSGALVWKKQDESLATYAHKISKSDVALSPKLDAEEFVRRVRASSSSAPARLMLAGVGTVVLHASVVAHRGENIFDMPESIEEGRIAVVKHAVYLGCSNGVVELIEIKADGKKAMSADEYARGARLKTGATWQ